MGYLGLKSTPNQWFLRFISLNIAFLGQEQKNIFENIYFSQVSWAPKIWIFQQNPKWINKKSTLIIVFTVYAISKKLKVLRILHENIASYNTISLKTKVHTYFVFRGFVNLNLGNGTSLTHTYSWVDMRLVRMYSVIEE